MEQGKANIVLVPHEARSAALARRRCVTDLLALGVDPSVVDDVALVLSELVGNAIRHGSPLSGGGIKVLWEMRGGAVHVEVHDGGRGPLRHEASQTPVGSADAETGRGLGIVGALSDTWGSAFDSRSAVVWADVSARGVAPVISLLARSQRYAGA